MKQHANEESLVPVVKLASVLHKSFSRQHAPIFEALLQLAQGESVKTRRRRDDGSAVWLRPTVGDVLAAQRLLFDRVWGKPVQALVAEIRDGDASDVQARDVLDEQDKADLAAVWHRALVRAASAPIVDAELVAPVSADSRGEAP